MKKTVKKKKDALQKALSFKNKEEEYELLEHIVNTGFVESIKKALMERGVSDASLAKQIGVSKSYVSQIFNGSRMLNINFITRIRSKFNIKLELVDTAELQLQPRNQNIIVSMQYTKEINNSASELPAIKIINEEVNTYVIN